MKFDSTIFDRVRVKPEQDRRLRPRKDAHGCEWPGCTVPATHRAPKGRTRENEYWRYCLEHVRAYNQAYNFFAGMSDAAVMAYQKDAITGHRPTWKMGTGKGGTGRPNLGGAADPFGMFQEFGSLAGAQAQADHKLETRAVRNAERKALDTMGLEISATAHEIKMRFKALVKRHHPDANGGDRSSEDKLRDIIQAYNYLRSVGFG